MNSKSLISIIVPLYNKEIWVERCIRSIISQTHDNIEIIVVNDGSTDNSREIVASFNDLRITIFDKSNGGVSSARNYGIEKSKGDYIAFLDADDEWLPKHLEVMLEGFRQFDGAVLVCDDYVEAFDNDMENVARRDLPFEVDADRIQYHLIENYLETLRSGYFLLSGSSVLIKASIIKENRLRFHTHIKIGEDVNYWLRLAQYEEFVFCDYLGLKYHRDDTQSAMNLNTKKIELVPYFFYGLNTKVYSNEDMRIIKRFLVHEYFKKAYQNRGLQLKSEELSTHVGGGIQISRINILPYLAIRYCPQFIFSLIKKGVGNNEIP